MDRVQKSFTALALVAAFGFGGCNSQIGPSVRDVAPNLSVEGPVVANVHATGVQIYACAPDASGALAWTLKGPDATFDDGKGLKGRHYAGPTWEAGDGSAVVGKKVADHVGPDSAAVPWLLLAAADHKGHGVFSEVTYIQRIHTTGGRAPSVGNAKAGDEIRVPYTADYVFYGKGAMPKSP